MYFSITVHEVGNHSDWPKEETHIVMSGWIEPFLHVYEVIPTVQNRRKFRQVARETCGESMEPPQDDLVMFGEIQDDNIKDPVVCVICARQAGHSSDPKERDFYHWINFLFVKGDFKRRGYGSLLLTAMEEKLRSKQQRPIRVESAYKAVDFFTNRGYKKTGEPIDCVVCGSVMFRTLQTMEKFSIR